MPGFGTNVISVVWFGTRFMCARGRGSTNMIAPSSAALPGGNGGTLT